MSDCCQHHADHGAITAVLHGYALALDTRDWDLLASMFSTDAIVDYSAEGGPICHGPAEVIADCQRDFIGLDATQHLMGNIRIAVDGDTARASSYVQACHFREAAAGGSVQVLAGTYEDELCRSVGGWLITRRALGVLFEWGNPAVKVQARPVKSPAEAPPSTT